MRDDSSLTPDHSVNGAPPRIRSGTDTIRPVARVKCGSCPTVAVLYFVTRPGRGPLLMAEVQVVEDWAARPVKARTANVEVLPGVVIQADCPAHGLVEVDGDRAVDVIREGMEKIAAGATRTPVLYATPKGRRDRIGRTEDATPGDTPRK